MPNNSITIEPSAKPAAPDLNDRIFVGPGRGANPIHKVGSAKQYRTKSVVGRVANQAKFPTDKSASRKRG
jgi:hypothetical protein